MSEADRARIQEILVEADGLGRVPSRVRLFEEAVRLADADGDEALRFEMRHELIHAASFAGYPEVALVAFGWCLGLCDRRPDAFDERSLLWEYTWVVRSLVRFAAIPRKRIEETLDDLSRRYERAGLGMMSVHSVARSVATALGDIEAAAEHDELHRSAPTGPWGGDCPACETTYQAEYRMARGEPARALESARPVLEGSSFCEGIAPRLLLGLVLMPLVHAGRTREAAAHHRRGIRLVTENPKAAEIVGHHLGFLAVTGNHDRALRLLARRMTWGLATRDDESRLGLWLGARVTLGQVTRKSRRPTRKLTLPRAFPGWRAEGTYRLDDLIAWLDEELASLANDFDRRNGNDLVARRVTETRDLEALDAPFPIRGR